jgi:hypothetical protein
MMEEYWFECISPIFHYSNIPGAHWTTSFWCVIPLFQSSLTLTLSSFYSRGGRVKTIRPMNDSALEAVSSESIESESAVGLSGTPP